MHIGSWDELDHRLVGSDRDADALIDLLTDGRSVVVAGPLGSGKSHLLREVVVGLRRRGEELVHIRSAAVLRDVAFGTLDAEARGLLERLRSGEPVKSRPVLIVDDAQDLDDDTMAAMLEALYARRTSALIGLTVPRSSHSSARASPTRSAEQAVNLWLSGFADRIDLDELNARDAHALLDLFPGAQSLDAVARAAIVWRADGSRLLLRELAEAALSGVRLGRDPIASIRDLPPHGRLADALAAHVRDLDDESRAAILLVEHAPGITAADAARFTSPHVIEALIARHLLHPDRSGLRRLTANGSYARAIERECGRHQSGALIDEAIQRLLAAEGSWWSDPIAVALADRWLRGDERVGDPLSVASHIRERVLVAASGAMNDTGDGARALAYASLQPGEDTSEALRMEVAYATLLLGRRWRESAISAEALGERGRARAQQIRRELREHGFAAEAELFPACPHPDDPDSIEIALERAAKQAAEMDCTAALGTLEPLLARPDITADELVRVETLTGWCLAYRGEWQAATRYLTAPGRANPSRHVPQADTAANLASIRREIALHLAVGEPCPATLERLSVELDHAAREGGAELFALAGLATTLAAVHAGDPQAARRELDAAMSRAPLPSTGPSIALTQVLTAGMLALHGFTVDARAVLDIIDKPKGASALVEDAYAAVTSIVRAVEGDMHGAREAARRALQRTDGSSAVVPRGRDAFLLAAWGDDSSLPELEQHAETTRLPRLLRFAATAREFPPLEERDTDELLRLLRQTMSPSSSEAVIGGIAVSVPRGLTAGATPGVLTRREREIAELVSERLTNREIAERLFLSVRTVESHIYQARAKLNAGTRHELGVIVARWMARRHDAGGRPSRGVSASR
jgi:DNA-binding CsgD family transcriptional regulator